MFKKSSPVETIQPVRFKQVVEQWLDKTYCNRLNGTHYRVGVLIEILSHRYSLTSIFEYFVICLMSQFFIYINVTSLQQFLQFSPIFAQIAGKREVVES